ncbi:alpha-L-fucosidase [Mucilaginibacter sp. PPCGB 2223]|uniref:glycoside hydrolase family 95 protein n=1 Tax=Mucilaginibacter sp. PPCGB 2223 TaxID=1886027 RepID=UPI000826ABDC|nr:glycoside hydrolase family 95 protein [Mucilaginibacter sp. PPCGB 2223]OCX52261.1 alpha-L-fucosidase [Mucilaginibacter sp. PPCGB 2223]
MRKLIFLMLCLPFAVAAQSTLKLWYKQPARLWTQALPVGNGRLGGMIFGKTADELIQLNESTLWSGGPVSKSVNPDAAKYLAEVRNAVFAGDYQKAELLSKKMQGVYSESYLPLADLRIKQDLVREEPAAYYRDLDIATAVSKTQFVANGVHFTREIFSSAPDQVIVIRLTADKPHALTMKIGAHSALHYRNSVRSDSVLVLSGNAPAHVEPNYIRKPDPVVYDSSATACKGMRYVLLTRAIQNGGTSTIDSSGIAISNATDVLILLSAATSFNGFDHCPVTEGRDELKLAGQYLRNAQAKSYEELLKRHIADYQQYFNRMSLTLYGGMPDQGATLPTDQRLAAYSNGNEDAGLEALYFQYGRYLLISSSRQGGTPANLQGIWNNMMRAPWSSNFTTNINVQMNYWPAETTNLSELHQPLLDLTRELAVTGHRTAREFYGLDGWVVHHNSDIWALSNPVGEGSGNPMWANWAMGANWLCRHLWDHYLFTQNKEFLKTSAYPLMRGAVVFSLGWLVKDKSGYWVTAPSGSPENSFKDENGKRGSIAMASTMDMSIIRDLFTHYLKAADLLHQNDKLRDSVAEMLPKLYPFQIGRQGNLVEWFKDFGETDPHHRHVSHLFGLYPGEQISPLTTPDLAQAAKKTLEIRGDEGTGWSKAWKINFWARLLDGNHAHLLIRDLLRLTGEEGGNYAKGGGTYANMFDAHPPFQIDGNFGAAAGIAEMLLQSQGQEIYLLPALPDAWKSGIVKGLKARGNFEVSIAWNNNRLTGGTITALTGGVCRLRVNTPVKIDGAGISKASGKGYVLVFNTEKGKSYRIVPGGK